MDWSQTICTRLVGQLLSANVAGFIHVKSVDMAQRKINYTAPCPGPLPTKYLIAGSIKAWL